MALREELEEQGNWLFKRRSYLPLVLFAPVFVAIATAGPKAQSPLVEGAWELFCVLVSLSGLVVRAVAVGHAPWGTSGRNTAGQLASCLNCTGLYATVRHPLYLGNYLNWLGVALFPAIWWVPVFVTLAFWIYYERIMFAEEEFLRRKFGAQYEEWAERTPAFLPDLSRWCRAALPFCWRTVLKREYSSMFAIFASFAACEIVERMANTGVPSLGPWWAVTFGAATLVYVSLLAMKKWTKVLTVRGR